MADLENIQKLIKLVQINNNIIDYYLSLNKKISILEEELKEKLKIQSDNIELVNKISNESINNFYIIAKNTT